MTLPTRTVYMVISVGNTDNRLSQEEWHNYTFEIEQAIQQLHYKTHFFGGPPNWYQWQNVTWVIELDTKVKFNLQAEITAIRKKYKQDSVFVMYGDGLMI